MAIRQGSELGSGLTLPPNATADKDLFKVVVYNSLTVDPQTIPACMDVTAWSDDGLHTVQGLRHEEHPIFGVQYHPESISSTQGTALLSSFLSIVHQHHELPTSYSDLPDHILQSCSYRVTASSSRRINTPGVSPYPTPPISPSSSSIGISDVYRSVVPPNGLSKVLGSSSSIIGNGRKSLKLVEKRYGSVGSELNTSDVFQSVLRGKGKERAFGEVWLDGQTPLRPTTTSIACPTFILTYNLPTRTITLHRPTSPPQSISLDDETFWDWFAAGQDYLNESLESPGKSRGFRGGWVGWMTYEMKGESLAGYPRPSKSKHVQETGRIDALWAYCPQVLERSQQGEWIARGIIGDQTSPGEMPEEGMISWMASFGVRFGVTPTEHLEWITRVEKVLSGSLSMECVQPVSAFPKFQPRSSGEDYRQRIDQCREAIRQGDSYELTLTTTFNAKLEATTRSEYTPPSSPSAPTPLQDGDDAGNHSDKPDSLSLYLRLRKFNPAYYSTFLNFPGISANGHQGISVLSSSPERFLKIQDGVVEMMPIKGTRARVKPGTCVCYLRSKIPSLDAMKCLKGKGMINGSLSVGDECEGGEECMRFAEEIDRRIGEELSNDPKERAENLMIVDLIRSDLLSCCPPSSVTVPKLIALESYGVHNLVTTVQGNVASNVSQVDVVRRCFPPGSMTGAPKLRSVQLLEGFEEVEKRGIYSGCLGYLSLDGSTDLSVVIRTMILEGDQLSIGAGGAITWLSNPEKEWDEVLTKVKSVVGILEGV